jgi:hypothetical protein
MSVFQSSALVPVAVSSTIPLQRLHAAVGLSNYRSAAEFDIGARAERRSCFAHAEQSRTQANGLADVC